MRAELSENASTPSDTAPCEFSSCAVSTSQWSWLACCQYEKCFLALVWGAASERQHRFTSQLATIAGKGEESCSLNRQSGWTKRD